MSDEFTIEYGALALRVVSEIDTLREASKSLLCPVYRLSDGRTNDEAPTLHVRRIPLPGPSEADQRAMHRMPRLALNTDAVYTLMEHSPDRVLVMRESESGSGPVRIEAWPFEGRWDVGVFADGFATTRVVTRLIKYFIGCMTVARNVPLLHGAAVSLNGRATLLLGQRGSGKSSLMYLACARLGAAYLSDDIISLWADGDTRVTACGWPNRLGVAADLLKADGHLERFGRIARRPENRIQEYLSSSTASSWEIEERARVFLDASEFFGGLDFRCEQNVAPTRIILPRADPSMSSWTVRRAGAGAAAAALQKFLAPAKERVFFTDYLRMTPPPSVRQDDRVIDRLADLPVYEVHYGPAVNQRFDEFWRSIPEG